MMILVSLLMMIILTPCDGFNAKLSRRTGLSMMAAQPQPDFSPQPEHKTKLKSHFISSAVSTTHIEGVGDPEPFDRVYNFRSVLGAYPAVPLYRSAAFDNEIGRAHV